MIKFIFLRLRERDIRILRDNAVPQRFRQEDSFRIWPPP